MLPPPAYLAAGSAFTCARSLAYGPTPAASTSGSETSHSAGVSQRWVITQGNRHRFDSCAAHHLSSAVSDGAKYLKNGAVAPGSIKSIPVERHTLRGKQPLKPLLLIQRRLDPKAEARRQDEAGCPLRRILRAPRSDAELASVGREPIEAFLGNSGTRRIRIGTHLLTSQRSA
jgi:hypothetical protein